ncbi:Kelch repeat-containing protein [Catelliglobosispora koreensis]|uniref:Kelch repeat-containing protein n=1 Tax=Catelliglobosispora koreensis TaxID=129052 RepID=UPI00037DCD27|nr:kelch repeat-containing protein [Catelliglobosispora koreensis]
MRAWLCLSVLLALGACDASPKPLPPAASGAPLAWRTLSPSPSSRTEVAATVLDKKIYVAGGYQADGATVGTVEVYDTTADRWTTGPELPVPVNHAMAATVSGTVYVFGGYDKFNQSFAGAFRLTDGGWQSIPDLPEPRAAATAAVVGERVYLAGGIGAGGSLAASMLVYDTVTRQWSTAPGMPTPREHLGGAGFDGRVYTVGGRTAAAGNLGALEIFDTRTQKWSSGPAMPTPRGGMSAAALCTGALIAAGGEAQATFPEVELFDLASGSWQALPPLPTPRHGLGVVTVGTQLYVQSGGKQPGLHVDNTTEALDLGALGSCR